MGGNVGGKQATIEPEMLEAVTMTWAEVKDYLREIVEDFREHDNYAHN